MEIVAISDNIANVPVARILLCDEDSVSRHNIATYLDGYGMRVTAASGGDDFIRALSAGEPDLIIIRVGADRGIGLDLVREVRRRSVAPLFVLNRPGGDDDRIAGLELGADDYLIEPFSLRELLARIRSTLRRRGLDRSAPPGTTERCYIFDGWLFDLRTGGLQNPSGEPVPLTKGEFTLLAAFVNAPRRTLSRDYLLQATRINDDVFDRSIDVQVLRLRRKLEIEPLQPKLIRTIRGIGYIFDTDPKPVATRHQPE